MMKDKRHLFLALVLALASLFLLWLPTGFEREAFSQSVRVKAVVLETDDSRVFRFGIVREGVQEVRMKVLRGPFKGVETTASNQLLGKMELDKLFAPGDRVLAVLDVEGQKVVHANVVDHYRLDTELLLFGLFAVLLAVFAGWTGVSALLSFVFSALAIWKVLLPGFLKGVDPLWLTFATVTVLTAVILFLVAGPTRKGLTAFAGAMAGLAVTALLSVLFGRAFQIHGAVKPFSETLLYCGFPNLDLQKVFLGGIFLAASGAVMDLAMDIAAAMDEMKVRHPGLNAASAVASGLAVGRSVIGTMTTTLLLAYSGGFSAMLMVFIAQGTPIENVLNLQYVASEILHTLVGSFGLVTVAPLTAIFGGWIYFGKKRK
ncbi:MAG: YibE/F family protein [Synergistaceae bacterium]|nr:YibE/F family protein [Synergistaceae bacterium]